MPGFGGYAGALGAGIAQGFDPAYDERTKQMGQILLGRTLQAIQQQQQQPQIGGPIQGPIGQPPMGGGMPPQQPPMAGGMPPQPQGSPQGGVRPQGGGMPIQPPRLMGVPPIGSQPQGGGQMQPQGGQQQGGMLDWRNILQAVMRSNPGAPPAAIASAVTQAIPLMNSQAQVEWKNYIAPQLAQQRIGVAEHAIESREGIAGANIQSREKIAEENIAGRSDVAAQNRAAADVRSQRTAETADKNREQRQQQFNVRETRIRAHQAITTDQKWQQLDQQRKAMEARIKQGGDRQALSQWRAILDAQHKRATEIIQGYSANNALPPDVRKQLLKDSDEAYQRAIKELNPPSTFSDRFTGGGQSSP